MDLRTLPKVRDSLSYLYVEHCRIEQEAKAIALHDVDGKTPVPCAALLLLMLGPGTSISHAAVRVLAESGCLVAWVGEEGVRFYAQGLGETRSAHGLLRQAHLCANPVTRLEVVMRMYRMRFREELPQGLTLQQIRGKEGIRVREAYARASRETGVPWRGRSYRRDGWQAADAVNQALSAANSCLYGVCHAAIVAAGYSPGLGFIHTGKMLSFVYDIADLYKPEITIPAAFRAAAEGEQGVESRTRHACRDLFRAQRLLARIVPDIQAALAVGGDGESDFDWDAAAPGGLWNPEGETVAGGVNYAGSDEEEEAME
ncbi:MAG: type I-E CRISPR-associated endonuclease Cas1 [Thermomicrobiales bacterium]|nr:type I-E CRISPR-associated endonuclease Cas1 [Thermomicrobiales bacterium]